MRNFYRSIQNKIALFAMAALAQFGPVQQERENSRRFSKVMKFSGNGGKQPVGRSGVPQHIQDELVRKAQEKRERKALKRYQNAYDCVILNPCINISEEWRYVG